jgi:hypothetical protein
MPEMKAKIQLLLLGYIYPVVNPGIFLGEGSTNLVDRGQSEWGSGGGSPLVRGFTQFANE